MITMSLHLAMLQHTKCPDDALSAMKMPKKTSPKTWNFLCTVSLWDENGKLILNASGDVVKEK
jgi:hypothetical protein